MNSQQEQQTVSRLVFELTITSSKTSDLDVLLQRLFDLLQHYPDLHLGETGAVLLRNPRGRYFQVARFGLPDVWKHPLSWASPALEMETLPGHCVEAEVVLGCEDQDVAVVGSHRALFLPMIVDGEGLGYVVLFVRPEFAHDPKESSVFSDLARAMSGLIQRAISNEVLRIRALELEEARADAIRSLGVASEYRDNETGWHIMRMTNFAQSIAKAMGVTEYQRELLNIAAPMHDVGKIGIADAILLKPGRLTPEEFDVMKTHTEIGVTILEGNDDLIRAAREIAGCHHERWDGAGYPAGLEGKEIPLLARICSVADVFDALTSKRPYKEPWTVDQARDWIVSESGTYFDPEVVAAFIEAMPEILRIRELYRDDIIDPKQVLRLPPLKQREDVWVVWDASLCVGIDVIDEHHRYLFDLVNDLQSVVVKKQGAREVARIIKALDAYAKIHFRAEEQMMSHYGYGALDQQLGQHHAFEEKLSEFYEELHDNPLVAQFDALMYLRNWLVLHIRVEDAKLATLTQDAR